MIKIAISGCNGHMGRVVESICSADPEVSIVAGFDLLGAGEHEFKVYTTPDKFTGEADVVVDFSSPSALPALLDYGKARHVPLVLATTGYSEAQLTAIDEASKLLPIFRSGNMSLGINLLIELVKRSAAVLGDGYDVEIVEKHHHRKVDAPSGTALMLADAAAETLPYQSEYVYDRHAVRKPRSPKEIGISSVRGGTIVGDHEVIFAGRDEVIELSHSAQSREVFASGAVRAAKFLAGIRTPGLYSMKDLVAATD
ncbi:MAG TPA: 4-hydroxy-tetrahydrodipicolinate reductase [Pseudoflavonifractor sp.]|nr:4-hydroxy-tetrahydrodipicolinate reductase [Pseudoflavonifractor sp.]